MEFVPLLVMLATVKKIVDLARYARGGEWNGVITQVSVWAGGVAVVVLVAQTDWASTVVLGGVALAKMGFWSQVFGGIAVGSVASLAQDGLKAVDNHQSEAKPTLLPPAG